MLVLRRLAIIGVPGLLVLAVVGLIMFGTDRGADQPPCSRGSAAAVMTGCEPGQRPLSFEDVMTFRRPGRTPARPVPSDEGSVTSKTAGGAPHPRD